MMLKQNDLEASIIAYESGMKAAITDAKEITLPLPTTLPFGSLNINEPAIITLAKKVITGKRRQDIGLEFLYIFMLADDNTVTPEQILKAFSEARRLQDQSGYHGKKNLCQENKDHLCTSTLYIGRSYSPRERLKQHLRESNGGTYAMHMAMWARNLDLKLEFFLYQFKGLGDRTMQVIEDGLWDRLRPLLGKRGER